MISNELKVYQRSENFIWTDEYIAKNMLTAHLDPENDAASRNLKTIEKTIDWILTRIPNSGRVLDLGCGPGLYASILAKKGYQVTGIDISQNSISYAKQKAIKENLRIDYRCADYVKDDIGMGYDAVICIYCDFGALIPTEQVALLKKIHNGLTENGVFIFDVFKTGFCDNMNEKRDWRYLDGGGFWCEGAHFMLDEVKHFRNKKVWGSRTIIIAEGKKPKEYIVWDHYYSEAEIKELLFKNGFNMFSFNNALVAKNKFTSNDVVFVEARKL